MCKNGKITTGEGRFKVSQWGGWSETARSVWGKTDRDSGASSDLVVHLDDTEAVALRVWAWAPRAVRQRLGAALGSEDLALAAFRFLAGVHDVGKATPAFAFQARNVGMAYLLDRMHRHGLVTPVTIGSRTRVHHTVTGQHALDDWLRKRFGMNAFDATRWAVVVGAHHGVPPSKTDLSEVRDRPDALGDDRWHAVRTEILETMATRTGMDTYFTEHPTRKLPVTAQVDLSALVIVCDWLASDTRRFPYGDRRPSSDRAADAWDELDLPDPWTPRLVHGRDPTTLLQQRFPRICAAEAQPIQRAAVQASQDATEPPLMIIEAPMGGGKTEAALLAAEILAARFGGGGVFFALPTMATSDAMFDRVVDWIERLPDIDDAGVHLAHSKAGLNDRYRGLIRDPHLHGVHDDDRAGDGPADPGVARAHGWLAGRKKGVLATFVVGTIDQVLFGGLLSKHLMLRLLALSGKVVVIDEVHAADDYMRVYLCGILTWLGAFGTPVILLSATLPPAHRRQLSEAYVRGRSLDDTPPSTLPGTDAYPRLTVIGSTTTDHPVEQASTQREVRLHTLADDDADLLELVRTLTANGGCLAIIRNTVSRAQQTYDLLMPEFCDDVVLAHSRFMAPHRMAREASLRARLGPSDRNGDDVRREPRPHRLIVVGTQVLEQSLDIDLDVMITDLCPTDLLLQRLGRLHRHQRPRPAGLSETRCYISGVVDWAAAIPEPVAGSRAVYGVANLLHSTAVLGPHLDGPALLIPACIPDLVARTYDPDLAPPTGWEDVWAASAVAAKHLEDDRLARASVFADITGPARPSLVQWLGVRTAADDPSPGARAAVRDSQDGLEVVVVVHSPDGLRVHSDAPTFGGSLLPDQIHRDNEELARAAAACTLRLPIAMCVPHVIDDVLDALERFGKEGWQESRWLRGQLILPLDADGVSSVAGFHLRYDSERGLTVTTEGGPG